MDFELSDEQRDIKKAGREFAEGKFAGCVGKYTIASKALVKL